MDTAIFHCPQCWTPFPVSQVTKGCLLDCGTCPWDGDVMDTIYDSADALKDVYPAIASIEWFHTTSDPNWGATIMSKKFIPMVHVGPLEAALDRAADLHEPRTWLYTLTIDTTAKINPNPVVDQVIWEHIGLGWKPKPHLPYDVYPYVNTWESPGSPSLVTKAHTIRITKKELLDDIPQWW